MNNETLTKSIFRSKETEDYVKSILDNELTAMRERLFEDPHDAYIQGHFEGMNEAYYLLMGYAWSPDESGVHKKAMNDVPLENDIDIEKSFNSNEEKLVNLLYGGRLGDSETEVELDILDDDGDDYVEDPAEVNRILSEKYESMT